MIYLDSNATTQPAPEVVAALLPFLQEDWQNPSSAYLSARRVRDALAQARHSLARLLNAQPSEITFTSGGTESINAVHASVRALRPQLPRLVISGTEHPAVLESAQRWQQSGGEVTRVRVTRDGRVDLDHLRHCVQPGLTALVSLMWANNETGVIHPLAEITEIAHAAGAQVHTDAVQAAGKIPLDVHAVPVDFLSLSGHKFHAPKGIGALYISRKTRFSPLILGGGQEGGRRSGTENVPYIVGLGVAAESMRQSLTDGTADRVRQMRDHFEESLLSADPSIQRNGDPLHRLPTTSSLTFPGLEASEMLILLDKAGLCCSAGSACHSASVHPSHVLEAMGHDARHAASTLRFSFSRLNTHEETQTAAGLITQAAAKLRELAADSTGPVTHG
ncbi:MAG: cysteine desulfurase [Verrucomicrobiales bacterium]|nr:cysteine desulfurase [Verrucomicrobiales bacterium]